MTSQTAPRPRSSQAIFHHTCDPTQGSTAGGTCHVAAGSFRVLPGKVVHLTAAPNDPGTKTEAGTILRNVLTEIGVVPRNKTLSIELVGEFAGLLSLQTPSTAETPQGGPTGRSVSLVAGVGFEPTTFRL